MELPSSPSSTITAPPDCREVAQRLGRLVAEAMTASSALLHYDNASGSMIEWCWPADSAGKKIPLSDFEKYRDEYVFRYPCCLCADGGGKAALIGLPGVPLINAGTEISIYFKLASSVAFQYPRRDDKNPLIPLIPLEWTFREQMQLLDRLAVCEEIGIGLLDAYIGLIANHKLQTEVRVLSFLLKDRVYPGDLWEIIGECTIEAQQEAILRQHQNICTGEYEGRRHVVAELLLMQERKKRGQMEVSLYTQAIEHLHQQRSRMGNMSFSSSTKSPCAAPSAHISCPPATRDKCEAWLMKPYTYPLPVVQPSVTEKCSFPDRSTFPAPDFSATLEDNRASVNFNRVGPSLPLLSAWVPRHVQDTFHDAFRVEQACQARLTPQFLSAYSHHAYPGQRNIGLELLVLQAKMRRAKAEVDLYTIAIEKACEHDFAVSTNTLSSPSEFIPLPRPDELCYFDEDHETEFDDFDDFEFD
ncbi:hypothetical protein P692DRAFT_20879848 [Suillus brevipes Sb2]|nr:hypothetical protein P692DRAFT_20879848 [Suillus brevipes Sb2]